MDSEPMCRACLSESGDAVPIFSSAETSGVQMALSDMLMACSSVQVISGDGLPSLICLECLRSLLIAFEFKLKCEKTDAMLREYIENNLVPAMQTTNAYNKPMTVDSNTLVQVPGNATAADMKQIVGSNELISGIPIAINNANTIYSNTNPYIIPMVECDVLVKEDSNNLDNKILHKCLTSNTEANMILKKINVNESQQSNITSVNSTVDMTSFSPRLISTEMIHPSPSQITIYSPEFRDLIRVSEEQATLVMPKMESGITTVNTMGQCSVLTTNSYTIEPNQCGTIIQNNIVSGNGAQNTNNNFLNTMAIPPNVAFTIKDQTVRKRGNSCDIKTSSPCEKEEDSQHILPDNLETPTYQIKVETDASSNESTTQQPVAKKVKGYHHKKKGVFTTTTTTNTTNVTETCSRPRLKPSQKDILHKNTSGKRTEQPDVVEVNSDSSDTETVQLKGAKDLFYNPNQGFIR